MSKILVVDDEADNRALVGEQLKRHGFEPEFASNGVEAIEKVRREPPDLVLLDVVMPGPSGVEVCGRIKEVAGENFVPVILLSAKNDYDTVMKGFQSGADDYISRPFRAGQLVARINVMLRYKAVQDELRRQNAALRQTNLRLNDALDSERVLRRTLAQINLELNKMAITDHLTHLYNRRFFFERLDEEFQRAARHGTSLACLMLDIDHFKKVNDSYGHQCGDEILEKLARILDENCRVIDLLARYGGEEFCVIMPNADAEAGLKLAERLRRNIAEHVFAYEQIEVKLTVSIGLAVYPADGIGNEDDLIRAADEACYEAKRRGRNCACAAAQR